MSEIQFHLLLHSNDKGPLCRDLKHDDYSAESRFSQSESRWCTSSSVEMNYLGGSQNVSGYQDKVTNVNRHQLPLHLAISCQTGPPINRLIAGLIGRSDGFLNDVSTFESKLPGAIALKAHYQLERFHQRLFPTLGIACPNDLATTIDKRKGEFLAGRVLAQLGFNLMGLPYAPVLREPSGAPQWPYGLAGTLSHAGRRCVCLLLPDRSRLVGVDTETWARENQFRAILRMTTTSNDRDLIAACSNKIETATLLFSGKETLFKLLHPVVQRHFGFSCAELCALPADGRLHLRLTRDLHPDLPRGELFEIRYTLDETHVTTWSSTPNPSTWSPGISSGAG